MIYFGSGKISELPGIVSYYGKSVLLVTGARSFMDSRRAGRLFDLFGSNGITFQHVTVRSEPSPQTVDDTVLKFAGREINAVVSIGGGSVIDAGKAISAMLGKTGSVTEYLEVVGNKEHPGTKVPFIAVPTTSGTGSEATKNAVISKVGRDGFKRSLRHDNFVPDAAIVDHELTLECPPEITAAAGMDCFTQLTEAYLSTKANEYTDALALEGIMAIKRSLVRSYTHGDDITARSDMSFAALTSGICLANAGLGAVHGLAGTIGALFDIPHGVVCGTLMADANDLNVRELSKGKNGEAALRKYATLGRLFSDTAVKSDNYYIDFFLDYLRAVTFFLDLPKLSRFGLNEEDLPVICSQSDVKNNPAELSAGILSEILARRL
ncbi:MAG: iron-containing alcohol dehydrogenase [Bacteroidales bacterium]|nr:iron-containing alcohol dehydrogenase [Bacteroidales bacterium]